MEGIKKGVFAAVFLSLLLLTSMIAPSASIVETKLPTIAEETRYGPRAPELIIGYYGNLTAAYAALKACDIDIMHPVLTKDQYDDAISDPNITLAPVKPPAPTINKYLKECLPDFGQHSSGWCWVAALANSLWWYSQNGFPELVPKLWKQIAPESLDPSPDNIDNDNDRKIDEDPYDGIDNDGDGRIDEDGNYWYCPCGEGYRRLMLEIAKLTPNLFTDRDRDGQIGEDQIDGKDNDGDGRVDEDPPHKVFCEDVTNEEYESTFGKLIDNGIYRGVLEWKVKKYNPTFDDYKKQLSKSEDVILILNLTEIYHAETYHAVTGASFTITPTKKTIDISDPWTPGGPDHNNDPKLKRYDTYEVVNENPLTIRFNGGLATVEKMYYISPTTNACRAYKNVCGVVNNIDHLLTFLNAYRTDDPSAPLRYGLSDCPEMLNPIYSYEYQDWQTLRMIYDPLIIKNPYNQQEWIPWLAQDLEITTWTDPETGENKTKLTIWFRKDAEWVKPVTGDTLEPLTTDGYEFNCWYYYQTPNATEWNNYNIHHIQIVDDYTVEVYYDKLYEEYESPQPNFRLYPPAWKRDPLAYIENRTNLEADPYTGYLPLPRQEYGAPVEIISCTDPNARIERGYIKVTPGATVDITYWARGHAGGYTPANLPWSEILIGTGPYFMIDHLSGVGGYTRFGANCNYFMPTPPLGEVDWRWYWIQGPKPRSGYFQIDISDVVKICVAYGSCGRGIPGSNWFPGADLAPSDGKPGEIDISDVVKVCVKYDTTFGSPPE